MKETPKKQFRSAKTGKYTTKAKAKKSPATTVSESNTGFAAYKKKENERLAKMRGKMGALLYWRGRIEDVIDEQQTMLSQFESHLKALQSLLS